MCAHVIDGSLDVNGAGTEASPNLTIVMYAHTYIHAYADTYIHVYIPDRR